MKFRSLLLVSGLLVSAFLVSNLALTNLITPAFAKKAPPADLFEGTTDEELKQLKETAKLPQPAQIKLAVLPFRDFLNYKKRVREATATTFLFWEHEGFQMVPVADAEKALAADKQAEPG